jgi:hypothetical protein
MTMRYHYRTDDAIYVTAADPLGNTITDLMTVAAGLGTAWRPPLEAALLPCTWLTPAGTERAFALPIKPATQSITAGVYRVWFRVGGAGGTNPLIMVPEPVVIYGGP